MYRDVHSHRLPWRDRMARPRRCRKVLVSELCSFCTERCPAKNGHTPSLRTRVINGTYHLCDGSRQFFYPTGEEPDTDLCFTPVPV